MIDKSSWKKVKFGDVVENLNHTSKQFPDETFDHIVGLNDMDGENLHILRWTEYDENTSFSKVFHKGQTLFGKRRAYQKKIAIAEFDGICSGDILVFDSKDKNILCSELIPFICSSDAFYKFVQANSQGSLSPRVSYSALSKYEFMLPDTKEQKHIAELLWAIEEVVQKTTHVYNYLHQTYDKYILSAMQYDNTQMKSINDFAEVSYGITLNAKKRISGNDYPYLRVANVQRNHLDLSEVTTIKCNDDEARRFSLMKDDILVVEGHADINQIGRAVVWNDELHHCLHQNHLIRIRCNEKIIPKFLLAWINSSKGRSYFSRMAQSTSGLNTINSSVVKRMKVPQCDIAFQEEICGNIDAFEKTIIDCESKIALGKNFLSAYLNKYFGGAN